MAQRVSQQHVQTCQSEQLTTQTEGHHSALPVVDFIPGYAFRALPYTKHITYSSFLQGSCIFLVCSIANITQLYSGVSFVVIK